ncbi:MAG: hypothetical protein C4527_16040 [Candidatus Omnitrophota bacterium]|jgi:hypothetical protein|nr:MAG: hypothetical protein C4527_16040 [Candidatus Omnitrophota bacterium]
MTKKIKPRKQDTGKWSKPHVSSDTNPKTEYLTISLRFLDPDYCLTKCDKDEQAAFADKVRILTQKKWVEILSLNRHGQGCEKIPCEAINGKIPRHVTPDMNLIAFRFHVKKPMVGYRNGDVFYVIWFDRNRTLYSHG